MARPTKNSHTPPVVPPAPFMAGDYSRGLVRILLCSPEKDLVQEEPGFMKRIAFILLGLGLLLPAAPVRADHPGGDTPRDIRLLQDDLENLDDVVAQLDQGDSRTPEFRRREERLQQEVVALRDQMQAHRRDN